MSKGAVLTITFVPSKTSYLIAQLTLLLNYFTAFVLAIVIVGTIPMGLFFLVRRSLTRPQANLIYGVLLISSSFVLIDRLIQFTKLNFWNRDLLFFPLNVSFLIGPTAFFFVKARLYAKFKFQWADVKHFLLPLTQIIVLIVLASVSVTFKETLVTYFFSPVTGNFERGLFAFQCTAYFYFAYRFVKHTRARAEKALQHQKSSQLDSALRYQFLVVGWLKRCYKVLITLFGIHAGFIVIDYVVYKLLDANLQTKVLFSSLYELSFAAVVAWLTLNGFFILRRKL